MNLTPGPNLMLILFQPKNLRVFPGCYLEYRTIGIFGLVCLEAEVNRVLRFGELLVIFSIIFLNSYMKKTCKSVSSSRLQAVKGSSH